MKGFQSFRIRSEKHTGISDKTSADHHGLHLRELPFKSLQLRAGTDIAVVAQRDPAVFQAITEGIHEHIALVKLLAHPGVNRQFPDGVAVEHLQDPRKLLRLCDTQPGFDGNGQRRLRKNRIQKAVQLIRISQHTGTLSFCHHRSGRTTDVQVHFVISPVAALSRRPEKILRHPGQQLRHGTKWYAVRHGHLPALPGRQLTVDSRGHKRHIVGIHTWKMGMMRPAVNTVRQSLHGRKIIVHRQAP